MRFIEAITIYLAVSAPFSVSYFTQSEDRGAPRLLRTIHAGLLWPLIVVRILITRLSPSASQTDNDRRLKPYDEKIREAKHRFYAAIHAVCDPAVKSTGQLNKELECASHVLRQNVETYVGLASLVDKTRSHASTNSPAEELFRVAGRTGEDLRLAIRCADRRNIARIAEHYARSRGLLLHAIADIQEGLELNCNHGTANEIEERRLRLAAVELYSSAFDLLTLLGDSDAATRIKELSNRESSWLRRRDVIKAGAVSAPEIGGAPCTPVTSRPSHAPLPSGPTLAQG